MAYLLGKLAWLALRPSNLFLLVAALGLMLQLATRRRHGFGLLAAGVLALVAASVLPVGLWLSEPLEDRFPPPAAVPERVDGVVVLGGSTLQDITLARGQPSLGPAAERLTSLVELARRYPEARILFTGGVGVLDGGDLPEAEIARRLVEALGLPPGRLELEDRARTTRENAAYALPLAAPRPGQRWLLVTSARHMPRAMGAFRAAGWPEPTPWPVDYRTTGGSELGSTLEVGARLGELDDAAYEWLGLLYYRLLGYTDALLPAPQAP